MAAAAVVGLVALGAGCSGSSPGSSPSPGRTIVDGKDTVPVARLVDAAAGLCQARKVAATDPVAARAAFFDRSHEALHIVARVLEPVDRPLAAQLLEAKQKVEAELDAGPPSLAGDLGRLSDVYRAGLGRLAIESSPCVE